MFFREHTVKGEMFSPSLGKWWSCHSSPQNRLRKPFTIWTGELAQHPYRPSWTTFGDSGSEIKFSLSQTGRCSCFLRGQTTLECQGLPDWKPFYLLLIELLQEATAFPLVVPQTEVWGEDGKDQQEEDQPAEWEAFTGVEWLQGWTDFHIAASQSLFWILRSVSVN